MISLISEIIIMLYPQVELKMESKFLMFYTLLVCINF